MIKKLVVFDLSIISNHCSLIGCALPTVEIRVSHFVKMTENVSMLPKSTSL